MQKSRAKTPAGVIEVNLCALLSEKAGPKLKKGHGPWPHTIRVVKVDDVGAPILLKVDANQVAVRISREYVAGLLREYVSYFSGALIDYNVPYEKCLAIVRSWAHQTTHMRQLPKSVGFRSDPAIVMARLDFDPVTVPSGQLAAFAPLLAGMLARVETNSDAFCARIGSIFDPDADRKQAVWVWGPADSGKSQFSWVIEVLSGDNFAVLGREELKTSYWKAQLVGRRVGIVQEAPASFIRSDAFKAATGDGRHSISEKYEKAFVANLNALFFLFSNDPPEIPHDEALKLRVIDCRVAPVPPSEMMGEVDFRGELAKELPAFVGHCLAAYEALPKGLRIPCKKEGLDDIIDQFEADYLDLIESHYVIVPRIDGLVNKDAYILRSHFQERVVEKFGNDPRHQAFGKRLLKKRFLCEEIKVEFQTITKDKNASQTKRLYVFCGIRERTADERRFTRRDAEGLDKIEEASNLRRLKREP